MLILAFEENSAMSPKLHFFMDFRALWDVRIAWLNYLSQIKVFKMEERLDPDAEMIYKKMGEKKYNKLVQDMKLIADKFKERAQRTKAWWIWGPAWQQ